MRGLSILSARLALGLLASCFWLAAQNPPQKTGGPPSEPAKPETAEAPQPLPANVDPHTFTLGPEDIIYVRVWREPELSGQAVIRPDGKITMPLINEVPAAGLTPVQLAASVTNALSQYVKNPQVLIMVQQVRSKRYYIDGEGINRPGAYPLSVPTHVFEAITLAGGFRDFANKKHITIIRGDQRLHFNYNEVVRGKNTAQNVVLENGDKIIVP